jgi:hypothetical protein
MEINKKNIARLPLVWRCENADCEKYHSMIDWDNFADGTPVCECGEDMVYLGVDTSSEKE